MVGRAMILQCICDKTSEQLEKLACLPDFAKRLGCRPHLVEGGALGSKGSDGVGEVALR
jgi:hypothetical protein